MKQEEREGRYRRLADALLNHEPNCHGSTLPICDDPEVRQLAIEMCTACPIFEPCQQVGEIEVFGIWAGKDRTRRRFL